MSYQRVVIDLEQLGDGIIHLTVDQTHYLKRVLRLSIGDRFIALDGQGHGWLAELTSHQAQVLEEVIVSTQATRELPIAITLLMAMPKGNGMDDIVRQATELGVATIVPILSDRTLLNPSSQKLERWRRIAQEATEQSERSKVPTLHTPLSWGEALQAWNADTSQCYLCEARGDRPHLLTCRPAIEQTSAITIAIGSEGGWTEAEITAAIAAGYQPISLGNRILRAVTAPIVALTILSSVFETMPESSGQD